MFKGSVLSWYPFVILNDQKPTIHIQLVISFAQFKINARYIIQTLMFNFMSFHLLKL